MGGCVMSSSVFELDLFVFVLPKKDWMSLDPLTSGQE